MSNSIEFDFTFLGKQATFNGQSISDQSIEGQVSFAQKVDIGQLLKEEWQGQNVAIPFPFKNTTAFANSSFTAYWNKIKTVLTVQLTNNNYWKLIIALNNNHQVKHFYLMFQPDKLVDFKKLPGIGQKLSTFIHTKISVYFATKEISQDQMTIPKGIAFNAQLQMGSKVFTFPTAKNTIINCTGSHPPIPIQQSIGDLATIDQLNFEYRKSNKNPVTHLQEPNGLYLQLTMKNTPLTILKGQLKAIRIGLILDKLPQMQRLSWDSNLALEVDFDLPIVDKKTGKKRLIALRPMQWLRKIGFPPPWLPQLFSKNKPQPAETKGITITKTDLTQLDFLKGNHTAQKYIPDDILLQRVVYDWKNQGLEMAVKVDFYAPLTAKEINALEATHTEPTQLLQALQTEAQKRGINTEGKDTNSLKQALKTYTGGFPLNNYPQIFKVNELAIYINKN